MRTPAARCSLPASQLFWRIMRLRALAMGLAFQPAAHRNTHAPHTLHTRTQQARNSGTRKPHPLRARERIAVQHSQAPAAKNDIPPHASTCPDAAGPMPPAAEVLRDAFSSGIFFPSFTGTRGNQTYKRMSPATALVWAALAAGAGTGGGSSCRRALLPLACGAVPRACSPPGVRGSAS